jgi:hypothetical protein
MKAENITTPEQLLSFLKSPKYWYKGFGGIPATSSKDEFKLQVQPKDDGSIKVTVMPSVDFIAPPSDLTDDIKELQ